tara:strand:- start:2509 stop:2715 length:207 start_codon:yes stop_codon:yes gene_type:complete
LKFGAAEVAALVTLVVIAVRFRLADKVDITQLKQLIQIQDVSILYVLAAVGDVKNHIHVQQEWDAVLT